MLENSISDSKILNDQVPMEQRDDKLPSIHDRDGNLWQEMTKLIMQDGRVYDLESVMLRILDEKEEEQQV